MNIFSIFFVALSLAFNLVGSDHYDQIEQNKDSIRITEFSLLLQPSTVSDNGIGVFAAHDIAQGTAFFTDPFSIRILKKEDVPHLFHGYCLSINDEELACPERFDRMEIGWYLHIASGDQANIEKRIEQSFDSVVDLLQAHTFYATRDIKAGEEIFINVDKVKEHIN